MISPWSWIEHDGKKRSGSWWKRRGRVKYNLRAHGLSFFLRGKKISPRNPNTFLSTRGAALKGLLQSIGRCRKGFDREREGRERRKKKIQKPSFYGKHQRIGGVSKFEGKKKRKLKFPSIHVSIANESVDIEIRRSRNVVANLSPPSPLRVKDDREGRYLLRRTDQDSILVPIHFETVCQSGDSNPTLWSFAMDLRLFPCPRQFRNPSCQSKRSNLFFSSSPSRDSFEAFLRSFRNENNFFFPVEGKKERSKEISSGKLACGVFNLWLVCLVGANADVTHFHIPIILQKGWLKFQRTFLLLPYTRAASLIFFYCPHCTITCTHHILFLYRVIKRIDEWINWI